MRIGLWFFIIATSFVVGTSALAETYRREVSFEWEEMPDAKGYDIEIRKASGEGKALTFKTKDASWSGKLVPGKYVMSLRSRDHRGVPGEWGAPSEFMVNLDPVKIAAPKDQSKITTDKDQQIDQKFSWQPVNGANKYRFELASDDGVTKVDTAIAETTYTVSLPVAHHYTWKVTGLGDNEMQSDSVTSAELTLVGKKLEAPKIALPESEFVREIKWQKPEHAEKFDLILSRANPQTRKWDRVLVEENTTSDTLVFDEKYEGGTYNLVVKAKGNLRDSSSVAKASFKVVSGDRSPAAEYTALVRKSIDRVTGWYAIASYLVTQIDYFGETPETGGRTTTTAIGGTGRLGAGYFSKDDRWGFLTIADMSGFTISGGTRTYSSLEVSGILRTVAGERGEARAIGGLYYQELPQLIGVPSQATAGAAQVEFVQSAVAGPHIGGEYWYSFTPKFGFQVNSHFYYSLLTMKSPNGNSVEPRLSYQVGLMGSYRFGPNFTGLMGLTHRTDQVAYKANKTGMAYEGLGDTDESRVTGDYLSFFAEYGF
jgi:hypothetical protein